MSTGSLLRATSARGEDISPSGPRSTCSSQSSTQCASSSAAKSCIWTSSLPILWCAKGWSASCWTSDKLTITLYLLSPHLGLLSPILLQRPFRPISGVVKEGKKTKGLHRSRTSSASASSCMRCCLIIDSSVCLRLATGPSMEKE